jgi:hypothetical protein
MLAALRPAGPYPLLALDGEQGSGKSTASRMVRRLVDPNAADVRAAPGNERDLLVAARGSQVLALDNLSFVPEDMADGLCRLATGGGFGERMLYTNGEEYLTYACNSVLLNGINSVLHRGHLADRAIAVTLLPIPDERRRPELEVWTEFEAAAPGVLAALLDGLVVALRRLPEVKLERLPRMADFARLACAAAPAFGWSEEEVLEALEANRAKTDAGVVDADPISIAVTEIADTLGANGVWQGTATRLLEQISETVRKERRNQKDWPKDATRLSPKLRRLAPALRKSGVEVTMPQSGGRAGRMIVIRLTDEAAGDERPMPPEEAHRLLEDAGKGMDDLLLDGFPVR